MPSSIPRSIREAWGKEATADFVEWFDQTLQERAVPRDEYREVLSRLDVLEHEVAGVKSELGEQRRETAELRREMNARFDRMNERMETRFDRVNDRFDQINERFDKVNERFDQMYERMMVMMRWTVGSIILFGTAVTVLLAIAQFTA